jgi:site-specific DNA-cytosine methylase
MVGRTRPIKLATCFSGLDMVARAGQRLVRLNPGKIHIQNIFAIDNNPGCCKVLENTLDHEAVHCASITDIDVKFLPGCDIFAFSPPCDDFSSNGPRACVNGATGGLILDVVPYIQLHKPGLIFMEQVRTILDKKHSGLVKQFKRELGKLGCRYKCGLLNSMHYGDPQDRVRWILVAFLHPVRAFSWPSHEHSWEPAVMSLPLCPMSSADKPGRLPPHNCKILSRGKRIKYVDRERNLVNKAIKNGKAKGWNIKNLIIDVGCSPGFAVYKVNCWPTLTRTRCASLSYWTLKRGRKVKLVELAAGFGLKGGAKTLRTLGVSEHALGAMLGNSVPMSLCASVLASMLRCGGFASADVRWC